MITLLTVILPGLIGVGLGVLIGWLSSRKDGQP